MSRLDLAAACVRDQRRQTRRVERRRALVRARLRRGQTLIIFALSITVLLGLAGLAIDVARAYDLYARMQRAAEAGALAGVLYMPSNYNTPATDGQSAVSRASAEVVKNGFGTVLGNSVTDCPTPISSVEVAICPSPTRPNDLVVTITEQLQVVLLSGLGVQPITLTAAGQADYLPPVQLGSRENYFGDQVECSPVSPPDPSQATSCAKGAPGIHLQYFMATMNGPADLKENGDPMVYCEEGPSQPTSAASLDTTATYSTYNGARTNHAQWSSNANQIQPHCGLPQPGVQPGNPDYQPDGFAGPATTGTSHPGGYNYGIVVPSGFTSASIWVFNPSFIPGDQAGELDGLRVYSREKDPFGNGVPAYNGHLDAPGYYFKMTYTVYQVNELYNRAADTLVQSNWYPPIDNYQGFGDPGLHGCAAGQSYDPYWAGSGTTNSYYTPITPGGCVTLSLNQPAEPGASPPCYQMWCPLTLNLGPGLYRLVVEETGLVSNTPNYTSTLTDGWGAHSYALKVCPTSSITSPVGINCTSGASGGNPGVSIFGWNNMDVNFTTPLSTAAPNASNPATSCVSSNAYPYACVDLGCIPTAYAGRTVTLGLFDPGDPSGGSGNMYIAVVPPPNSNAPQPSYPSWMPAGTVVTMDGDSAVTTWFGSSSYNEFNGLWLNVTLRLPPNYVGNCSTGASSTGWWQLAYITNGSVTPGDYVNVQFTLVGSPVHLVPPQLG